MDKDDMDEMDFLRDDLDAANERIKVLVEAANNVVRFIDNDSFDTSGWREAVDKLKAELAEVK